MAFALQNAGEHVVVLDRPHTVVFRNDRAGTFLGRHGLPAEVSALVGRIFAAIERGSASEQFPGQIRFHQEVDGRAWAFRIVFRTGDWPLVGVYFSDETVSSRFDLNALRQRHRLTRRETDVLRHLLDGRRNLQIAEELAITEQTVKDYLSCIYVKVGVPDRFALLRRFIDTSPQ